GRSATDNDHLGVAQHSTRKYACPPSVITSPCTRTSILSCPGEGCRKVIATRGPSKRQTPVVTAVSATPSVTLAVTSLRTALPNASNVHVVSNTFTNPYSSMKL